MKLEKLIDQAAEKLGSRYKVAQYLGVSPNLVNDWYKGRVPCQPADQARIADISGENAQQVLIEATIARHEGTPRGEQLKSALRKWTHQLTTIEKSAAVPVLAILAVGKVVSLLLDLPRSIEMNTGLTGDELADLG